MRPHCSSHLCTHLGLLDLYIFQYLIYFSLQDSVFNYHDVFLLNNCVLVCLFSDTSVSEIEDCFKRFVKRDDVDIILINQNVL